MRKVNTSLLFLSLLICFSAAAIGSLFTYRAIPAWYASLVKPSFSPPNWVFGPVWTVLYTMMGIALYTVWNKKTNNKEKKIGLRYFSAQLVLNTSWSIIFFGMHSPVLALLVIIALWAFIFFTIQKFMLVSKTAGVLLVPYLLWVSFATLLNFSIVLLNR